MSMGIDSILPATNNYANKLWDKCMESVALQRCNIIVQRLDADANMINKKNKSDKNEKNKKIK